MKILYVTTIASTINGFMVPHILYLLDKGHQVDIACNVDNEIDPRLTSRDCKVHHIEFQRSPLNRQNYTAYQKIKRCISTEGYDVVHTHTPVASAVVRLACRKMASVKVLYTTHGFHFYKGAPLKNWLLYYTIEKYLAKYTDVLITINEEDYQRATENLKAKKTEYIPGIGFDYHKFCDLTIDKLSERKKLAIPSDAFLIVSAGEVNRNKNHEVIIRAIAQLNNPTIYFIICGEGPLTNYLIDLAKRLQLEKNVKLLGFRKDIGEICKAADVFAFPSKREGLGLAALEAMSTGLPIITSNVHGIVDYSVNGVTGFNNKPTDVAGFAAAIQTLLNDTPLKKQMGINNVSAAKRFDIRRSLTKMEKIYDQLQ